MIIVIKLFDGTNPTSPVTILAFLYLPLNTVTSVYGMNVQQINESGHNIWTFVVTALVAVLVTGLVWYVVEGTNNVRTWKKSWKSSSGYRRKPITTTYTFEKRIFMLLWLIRHGHFIWMLKSGAGFAILTNINSRFTPNCSKEYLRYLRDKTACDYVLKVIQEGPVDWYPDSPFSLRKREASTRSSTRTSSQASDGV